MLAGPLQGELPPPGPLADTGLERPIHPSLCAQAPGCRAPRVRGKRGPRSRLEYGRRPGRRTGPAPGGPGRRSRRSRGPWGNRTRRPGLAWPPEQGTRPPRASGQCSVGRTGLGASRTFLCGPIGVGASVVAGVWAPGSSGGRPGSRLQLEASRSSGHVLLPGPGAGAGWGGAAGEGGRPRWPGVGIGGEDRGWGPGSRAGARSWAERTRADPGPGATCSQAQFGQRPRVTPSRGARGGAGAGAWRQERDPGGLSTGQQEDV